MPNKTGLKLIEPKLPGGFRDALPEDAIAKEKMTDTVKTVFERFGFDPMQTPAMEKTGILVRGEEGANKIIFRTLPATGGKIKGKSREETSLRFDLTIPLARVLAANPNIPKPFKRYQIAKVWRGERQQAGRYREFIQADIDIVGVKSMDADAEIIQVMYEVMTTLGVENFKIRTNNKKEAVALLEKVGIPAPRRKQTLIAIDKKEKLAPRAWEKEVQKASGLKGDALQKYLWQLSGENMLETTAIRGLREEVEALGVPQKFLIYDASLVRGLGYYTGSMFEMILLDLPEFGSICGGGRYDGLTERFSQQILPAVGVSFGIDRLFVALERLGKMKKQKTLTRVLIFNLERNFRQEYGEMAKKLRSRGVNTTVYLGDDRTFQAQLAYAVKKEIPYVVIMGDREKKKGTVLVKNLGTRKQQEVPPEKLPQLFAES